MTGITNTPTQITKAALSQQLSTINAGAPSHTLRSRRRVEDGCRVNFIATDRVVQRQPEEGFSVSRPGLLGCWPQGASEEEAL